MSNAVHDMFAGIAGRYDAANDVLSFGVHRLWRREIVRRLRIAPGAEALDLCTGTGDLALLLARAAGPNGKVYGVDFVEEMLKLAETKRLRVGDTESAPTTFLRGDAMSIPFPDNSFDIVTIAFGIRNVDDPSTCLREITRVLRPGGRVGVLEFGQPTVPGFSALYRLYSKHLMPAIGGAITGDRDAYVYLPETSKEFPCGVKFASMMTEAGLQGVAVKQLFGGISYIYTGSTPGLSSSEAVSGKTSRNSIETKAQLA
jgi:demethylmenaquinone methyltransferase/2-methoxy-6-polyprenyl-1,4-benzoquinol methylase